MTQPSQTATVRHLTVVRDDTDPALPTETIDLLLALAQSIDHVLDVARAVLPEFESGVLASARNVCEEMAAAYAG